MLKNGFEVFRDTDDISVMSVFEQLLSLPEMTEYASNIDVGEYGPSRKIYIFGIGPSAIAGDVISAYTDYCSKIPVMSVSNGIIPSWIDEDTDVILVSYTGKNKIINKLYDLVKERNHSLTCITSGDHLMEKCQNDGKRLIQIPEGLTSRTALGMEIGILASIIQKMKVCDIRDCLKNKIPMIKKYRDSLFEDQRIETLVPKLKGNTIAFYGAPWLRPSFKRWKMSFSEDLGSLAFCGELPEFNHNEIVGWANHNQKDDDLKIVFLRGGDKNSVLAKIIDKTLEVLEESGRHVMDLQILGDEPIEMNLRAIILGDFVSQVIGNEGRLPEKESAVDE